MTGDLGCLVIPSNERVEADHDANQRARKAPTVLSDLTKRGIQQLIKKHRFGIPRSTDGYFHKDSL
jgi:hypothetical protein